MRRPSRGSARAHQLAWITSLTERSRSLRAWSIPRAHCPCVRDYTTGNLIQTPQCEISLPASQPNFARSDRFKDWALYAQDAWKPTPRLTVNYGLRYEYYGIQHNNQQNLDSNFYYGTGSTLPQQIRSGQVHTVPDSPIARLWNPQYGTVGPRVGFAYDINGNGKTSLRGGYGIAYEGTLEM
jgi:outer membrane receptor protein involved in Fe transport